MNTLNFILWKWRDPSYDISYEAHHVNTMVRMLERHTNQPHRVICITDDPEGIECETFPLWNDLSSMKNESWKDLRPKFKTMVFPSCYRRLKIFSREVTNALGINDGERVVSLDIDTVITDTLDPLFDRSEDFVGWHSGPGHTNPSKWRLPGFNGSVWMFRAGACEYLWNEFDPVESPKLAKAAGYLGSDQGWMSYKMFGKSAQWTTDDGIRRYFAELMPVGATLLPATRIVAFPGTWKPWDLSVIARSPWITEHYR